MPYRDTRFSVINKKSRIWAFGSIHSDYKRLKVLHSVIFDAISPMDYFIYMGNIIGMNEGAKETFAEILEFKQKIKEKYPEITDKNFIFLRGLQEEMWQKTLYIHLSDKDDKVFNYIVDKGVDGTLKSYGFSHEEGYDIIEKGAVATSAWTEKIREEFYKDSGYKEIFSNLKHAVYTEDKSILFVSAGIDHKKTLEQNKDEFWWGGRNFIQEKSYQDFNVVVRGFAPDHSSGIYQDEYYITATSKPNRTKQESLYVLFFNENNILEKGIEV